MSSTPRRYPAKTAGSSSAAKLWEAAERGDAIMVQAELDRGVDVDAAGRSAWTALHRAADRGWVDVLRVLLQHGANSSSKTDTGNDTPLHLAAARGHVDITRELLRGGADYRMQATNGWTPLHAAMFHNHTEVARQLIRAGADPIAKTGRGSSARTLSVGGAPEKWTRGPPVSTSSLSEYSEGSLVLPAGGRAMSPGRAVVRDVMAARQLELAKHRQQRSVQRERERMEAADAALQQHLSHSQRRDEKRRQLELALDTRVSQETQTCCYLLPPTACRLSHARIGLG